MDFQVKKLCICISLLSTSLSIFATHYINKTGKNIIITNVSAKKRGKKSYFNFFNKKNYVKSEDSHNKNFIELEDGLQGDLDNQQGDEITITSVGMNDKRKLFPTNNSFNYVVTMNKYKNKFEQFDINHAE
jgi:hypothetical protein